MGKYSFSKFLSSEITTRIRLSGVRCKVKLSIDLRKSGYPRVNKGKRGKTLLNWVSYG